MRTVVGLAVLLALPEGVLSQTPPRVNARDAGNHRGDVAAVCGLVIMTACTVSRGMELTFEDFNDRRFSVIIRPSPELHDAVKIETRFDNLRVCVTGLVEKDAPSLRITGAQQAPPHNSSRH